jgi:DNA modification methylase
LGVILPLKQAKLVAKKIKEPPNIVSYSRDKPNPHLKEYIDTYARENLYDPLSDKYDVKAFDKPITTTKATAIYYMHTYWSKKPHDAIQQYIQHYTRLGDLVLDPFCGSGGTALAALMEGRNAIAIDLSPAATFITKNYCSPIDEDELQTAFNELKIKIKPEIDWLYETRCDCCGGKATTVYTVYSQVFQCPRCLEKIPLFDCPEVKTYTENGKEKKIKVCPHCHSRKIEEEISTAGKKFGAIPVLISYLCEEGCVPQRKERRHNDPDPKKRDYFDKYDLGKIGEIERKQIPYWFPSNRMMNNSKENRKWGELWRSGVHEGIDHVFDFYTKRNLWALSAIRQYSKQLFDSSISDVLLFTLSSILFNCSKMYRYRSSLKGGFQNGTYYVPPESQIINVWRSYTDKFNDIIKGYKKIKIKNNVFISTEDATNLSKIPDSTIDFIFTDPPYSGTVQYGELNFIWEAWLDFNTNWQDKEIIVNDNRKRTMADWAKMMKEAMRECHRVLKPGRWISLCYHDASEGTWQLLQDLMTEVGFVPEHTDSALFIDTGQKSYNQLNADKVTKRDLVFNYRKPMPGEASSFLMLTGKEDSISFNEKASAVIRDFLLEKPGSTKDRIFDALVSHMVSRSQMQSHDFISILKLVAQPVTISGSDFPERWYLMDSELDIADVAETSKEESAAQKVTKFIEKYRKEHPELEGVHYSDIFEYYLYSVKDKPRRPLSDWLLDYFFITSDGTYRLPVTSEEEQFKKLGRIKGLNRKIKRLISFISQGIPVPENVRPDNMTLAEWILHSRRAGLYFEGKILVERAGLDLDALNEEMQVEIQEAYQTCCKMIADQNN